MKFYTTVLHKNVELGEENYSSRRTTGRNTEFQVRVVRGQTPQAACPSSASRPSARAAPGYPGPITNLPTRNVARKP